jgi:hypothetical protein
MPLCFLPRLKVAAAAAEGVEVEEHSQMMEAAAAVVEHSRMMEAVVVGVVVVVEYSQMMVVEGEGEENPHMQVEGVAKH